MPKLISVIIPVYNEEKVIAYCLESLKKQTYKPIEIIIVDDGSTDKTLPILRHPKRSEGSLLKILRQNHQGPGPARNLGAKNAKGEILVFVDADMTFDKNFLRDLTKPILKGETIGTFSKNEMVKNSQNIWSICWNINKNLPIGRMIPKNYPNTAPIFRAILKEKFDGVAGFDTTGEYTDDWSLSRKLGIKSRAVEGAIYFHLNPESAKEVWNQARWIGKNKFIVGNIIRRLRSLMIFSLPLSTLIGISKSISKKQPFFIIFKLVYDQAVFVSILKAFFGESKSK